MPPLDPAAFILANTQLERPVFTPEIALHLATEITPIWSLTEAELNLSGLEPPFWAFAWAGGLGLARYVLDHQDLVAGKTVVDFASGSGLVALAAKQSGAARVIAADIDPFSRAAILLNAAANGLEIEVCPDDLLASPPPQTDVLLTGDIFYDPRLAAAALPWLQAAARQGALVLIGDPGRTYFPKSGFRRLAEYQTPTTRELEDAAFKRTQIWTLPEINL